MKNRILTGLILLNLALIWGNSAMTASESSTISGGLLEAIAAFLPFLAGEEGHHFLRKAAHFIEFALLGFLSGLRRPDAISPGLLGFGLMAACVDETIQLYVPGRASSLLDVWLDTAGFTTGVCMAWLVINIPKPKQRQ